MCHLAIWGGRGESQTISRRSKKNCLHIHFAVFNGFLFDRTLIAKCVCVWFIHCVKSFFVHFAKFQIDKEQYKQLCQHEIYE